MKDFVYDHLLATTKRYSRRSADAADPLRDGLIAAVREGGIDQQVEKPARNACRLSCR